MKKLLKEKKGFTLVELMVVVIIVGILAAVAVPLYRGNVKKAQASEGQALLGSVRTAQRIYYAEHDEYGAWADISDQVELTDNRYFTNNPSITLSTDGSAYTATAVGAGDASDITVTITEAGVISVTY